MSDLLYDRHGAIMLVTLNRPQALNALTLDMARALEPLLGTWGRDDSIKAVVIQGAGDKAFCAGGDIMDLYRGRAPGGNLFGADFFRAEYKLNRAVKVFPKPYIALMDGVTMGGGVGLSVHGSHRVVTERTLFAMPETGIGLFPDVGGSYFLPRLPGGLGLFLGLTGWRIKAADCVYAGIGDHAMRSAAFPDLIDALAAADWDAGNREVGGPASAIIADFAGDPGPAALAECREGIDRAFGAPDLDGIFQALRDDTAAWAAKALALLEKASPTSLAISLEQLRRGATLAFDDCMTMEYRLSQACLAGDDFYEGIRAAVVDKDRAPRWNPARREDLSRAAIEHAFAPLGDGDLLF